MNKKRITLVGIFIIVCQISWAQFNFQWAGGFLSSGAANLQESLMVSCVSTSVDTDGTGNVYTTGHFDGTIDFDPSQSSGTTLTSLGGASEDVFISKLDAQGNFVWVKRIGGIGNDQGQDIHVDQNNDVLITGSFASTVDFDPGPNTFNMTATGTRDIFILKLNAAGDFLWAVQLGGVSPERGYAITTDASGNIFTTGSFESTSIDLDPGAGINVVSTQGGEDMFVQKLDPNGNYLWAHAFGGTGNDLGRAITCDASGNVYICGEFQATVDFDPSIPITLTATAQADKDGYVLKLDSNGNYSWVQLYACDLDAQPRDVEVNSLNEVFVSGYFQGTIDIDPSLNTNTFISSGGIDGFVQKLDANGNLLWANQFGGAGTDGGLGISLDNSSNVYVAGAFNGTVDLDPGAGTFNLTANGDLGGFVQKLNTNGDHLWAYFLGNPFTGTNSFTLLNGIALDNGNNIITTGWFNGALDCDPTAGVFGLSAGGINLGHVEKIGQGSCSNTFATDIQVTCDSLTWIDGNTYTTSNTSATFTLPNAAGCDSIVTLDLTITNSTSGVDVQTACNSYTWIDGNTYTSSNNSATYMLTNAAGCDSVVTLDLTINTVNTTTSVADLTITADVMGATYQWIDCDNNNAPISGETGQSFTATVNGNYAVIVTENGCSDTSSCVAITTVGIHESASGGVFSIYPNPTDGEVILMFGEVQQECTVQVRDAQGRMISITNYPSASQIPIELGDAVGVYFIMIQTNEENYTVQAVKQ